MDDLIKRQDAIGKIKDWMKFIGYRHSERNVIECTIQMLEELPSAEPERKKGNFIGTEYDEYADDETVYYEWKCSECGCVFEDDEPTYNFCPNCGSDMRGEEE